ncbi:hypothetical protein C0Q70_19027 [Pomacea canaliculata]|uniref:Uncharacterized protein n=1 Tax=Pomacea canaliculata TaxID=400727 RepID=A0A2T7NI84_POMCA|nr:hypothetical protein C0Q70_19027 [Pomacea canaliculata]
MSEVDIKSELVSQGVPAVQRVILKKDRKSIPTNTLFLTFCLSQIPDFTEVGYLWVKVYLYLHGCAASAVSVVVMGLASANLKPAAFTAAAQAMRQLIAPQALSVPTVMGLMSLLPETAQSGRKGSHSTHMCGIWHLIRRCTPSRGGWLLWSTFYFQLHFLLGSCHKMTVHLCVSPSEHDVGLFRRPCPKECRVAQRAQKKAQRLAFRQPTPENVISFKHSRADARAIFKQARKLAWQRFRSSLSSRTTSLAVWAPMRKIKGMFQAGLIGHLQVGDSVLTEAQDVGNSLACTIAHNYSSLRYSPDFQCLKSVPESSGCLFLR